MHTLFDIYIYISIDILSCCSVLLYPASSPLEDSYHDADQQICNAPENPAHTCNRIKTETMGNADFVILNTSIQDLTLQFSSVKWGRGMRTLSTLKPADTRNDMKLVYETDRYPSEIA